MEKNKFVHPETHDLSTTKEFLREIVFGFNDGLVSIFGLTAGLVGAYSSNSLVAIAGIVGAIAAAISMGLGTYISTKSQKEVYDHEIEREKMEIEEVPDIERQEIREIYSAKGFKGKLLEQIVKQITSDKKVWLKVMMEEELGFGKVLFKDPVKAAFIIFVAFIFAAAIPILPYLLFKTNMAFAASVIFSCLGLFIAGSQKGRLTNVNWIKSGAEMFAVGAFASGSSYLIGTVIAGYFGLAI